MELKTSIDIGQNLTNLIEQLAKQLGTSVETIFPWFVKEQIISGIYSLSISLLILSISLVISI